MSTLLLLLDLGVGICEIFDDALVADELLRVLVIVGHLRVEVRSLEVLLVDLEAVVWIRAQINLNIARIIFSH